MPRNRASLLKRVLTCTLLLALLSPIVPGPRPPAAATYITDTGSHPPPTSGPHAYFATYGTFSPGLSGFPAVGGTFVDPVFGSTIRRLTNELNQHSYSENYAKNGFINADATLMHHRAPSGHNIINTTTGQVVRASVPFNMDSSFAPDNPDIFYWFNFGSPTLNKYSVSTGASSVVKTFSAGLTQLGGSVDWIDGSGRYMVLMLGGAIRVYDVKSDILYAGSIPASYASSGGWVGISPDGNYVITATDPAAFRSFRIDHTAKSVSASPVLFWTLCGDHADIVSSSNGKTYLVAFECHSEAAIYAVDVTIPQSAGDVAKQRADNKRIIKLASWTDTAGHFSGVSKGALKDWFFFTIESGDDTFTAPVTSAWRPYMQELIMANVVTGEVRRLAHHRSRSVTANYFYTPRPSASWDGSLVTWVSNFGHSSDGYVDLYAIRVDGATTEPPPPPPPTSTPLTVSFTNPGSGATVSGIATVSVGASGGSGSGYTYTVKAGTATIYNGTNSSFSWNTTTSANGGVTLSATVTDSAAATASASRLVTVSNGDTSSSSGNVIWTNPVNVAVSGNTITKNGGCSGCWDSGANSQQTIASGSGSVQFTVSSGALATVGLTGPNSGTSADTIKYGLRFFPGYVEVRENGVWKESWSIASGNTHKVAVEGGVVKYYLNTTLKYTSALAPTYPLVADATLETTGSAVQNAVMNGGGTSSGTGDTTAPTVSITAPAAGATVSGTVTVSASASDNVGVTSVQFKLDGTNLGTADTTSPYSLAWNTSTATPGTHTLTAVAKDAAGNTTTSAPVTVTISSGGGGGSVITLDNASVGVQDGQRSFTGTWCVSAGGGSFGTKSLYSCSTAATYRWTPTIAADATYDVYVWWTSHANRSTAVPLSVVHAGGTTTKTFNQQVGGGQWVLHGRYAFNAGTAGHVAVSSANGQATADAVRFVAVATSASKITTDNAGAGAQDAQRSFTGTWCASSAGGSFGTASLYSCSASATYRWTPTIFTAATYDVYVWWTSHANRSTAVPLSVVHAGGTTTKTFDQQVGGGQWVLHGRYAFNAGTAGYVAVSGANGQAAADAVQLVPVP